MTMKSKLIVSALIAAFVTFIPASRAVQYPVKVCIVTGDDLGDDPVVANYKGEQIPLCCKSCLKKFNANPQKYTALYDKELAKRKK